MQARGTQWLLVILLIGMLSMSISCGGGGDDGIIAESPLVNPSIGGDDGSFPENPLVNPSSGFAPVGTEMTMTQENAELTSGLVMLGHSVGDLAAEAVYIPLKRESSTQQRITFLRAVIDQISAQLPSGTYHAAASQPFAEQCLNTGGTASGAIEWTGPEKPADPYLCDISDVKGQININNCVVDDYVSMSGSIAFQFSGSFCRPLEMNLTLTDFSYSDSEYSLQSEKLQINISGLMWTTYISNYGVPVRGASVINGQAVLSLDGVNNVAVAFDGYREEISENGYAVAVYGNITGPCLDGWAALDTITPVRIEKRYCPSAGQIEISGTGDPTYLTFNADGSATVGDVTFSTCDELENFSCPLN